jgi:hypothetical protein
MVICLQIPTVFWKGRRAISLLSNVHRVSDVRQIEIHTADLSPFEIDIAIENLRKYESPGSDEIPAELIQVVKKNLTV